MLKKYSLEIKWTLIFALANMLWAVGERVLGFHDQYVSKQWLFSNLFLIVAFAIFYFAISEKKSKVFKGEMGYQDGFIMGMIITFLLTIVSPFVQIVIWLFISPNFFENAINYTMTIGQYTLNEARAQFSLSSYLMQSMVSTPMMGFTITAIVAFLLKSKQKIETYD